MQKRLGESASCGVLFRLTHCQEEFTSFPHIQLHPWAIWTVAPEGRTGNDRGTTSVTWF